MAAWLLVLGVGYALHGVNRRLTLRRLRIAQSVSAAAVALGHGLQDGQKTMGAIVLALVAAGRLDPGALVTREIGLDDAAGALAAVGRAPGIAVVTSF